MGKKDDILKIKVTTQQKELIKEAAEDSGLTINEFALSSIEDAARKKVENFKNKEIIEERIIKTEKNIEKLKLKLNVRKNKNKEFKIMGIKLK